MSSNNMTIRKVAVLGSGVMGSQIAAHCVNAGLDVLLLDLKSDDPRNPNKIAEGSLKKIQKMKPAPFALPEFAQKIKVGNFDDDLNRLADVDWICEVVVERMDIKKEIISKIDKVRKPGSIVSSNTSGLPITKISEDASGSLKEHFLGTHFFNPPRYMKLLEIIPTENTSPDVVDFMKDFCEKTLGKGVVICNDTPNFIANRIGVFSIANIFPYYFDGSFSAEKIDLLTGKLTGYSKAATFRTADMVGLDVISHVAKNLIPEIPNDERKEVFDLPQKFNEMVASGKIGNKSGEGFYKKTRISGKTAYLVFNHDKDEYVEQAGLDDELLNEAKKIQNTAERLKFLVNAEGRIADFVWNTQKELLLYAANRMPEITEDPQAIDRAMKWGFNWELGPFERWDALGIQYVVDRAESEGIKVPGWIYDMLESGYTRFYIDNEVYNPQKRMMQNQTPTVEGALRVSDFETEENTIFENDSAALLDMGDGVALFAFKTKNATLGSQLVLTLNRSLKMVEEQGFKALVIGHDGENFAYGANLMEALEAHQNDAWYLAEETVTNFQKTAVALKYAPFPVVTTVFGRTLGGGVEFSLYSDLVVAHLETYMGLVEVGVGLIPAGGGTTELLKRAMNKIEGEADPLPFIREAFKTMGMAKVSESAFMAKQLDYLKASDVIVMNRDLLLKTAKQEALNLVAKGYQAPQPENVKVLGKKALAAMKLMLYVMHEGKFITDYDKVVVERLAFVLAGGDLSEAQYVPEEYLFKLEREAILECLGDERTLARIEHLLKTGKPLRN